MSIVASVIDRIKTMPDCPFKIVDAAAGLAEIIQKAPNSFPAAYVYVKGEAATENQRMTGRVLQRVEADIGIMLITKNLSGTKGGTASLDIESLKAAVMQRLLGFEPLVAAPFVSPEPLTYAEGEIARLHAGIVWFEQVFAAAYYVEEQP